MMPARIGMPSAVPLTRASKELAGGWGRTISASSSFGRKGTIRAAMARAAGVEITEAIMMWPRASGMTGPRMAA